MRIRQLSKTAGALWDNFIKSMIKTIFSEAICMMETCDMDMQSKYSNVQLQYLVIRKTGLSFAIVLFPHFNMIKQTKRHH